MELIASFQIDHLRLKPGLYVSRKDKFDGVPITTFDMRMKETNKEPVMDMPVMHTLEHLAATYMRSRKEWTDKIVYVGPMGCRTGCYFIIAGEYTSQDLLPLVIDTLDFIINFEGAIPGAQPGECGNWREHNLEMTKYECKKYAAVLKNAKGENLKYPSDNV